MKRIVVNSQARETSANDIATLIVELGFVQGSVLVEHNGTALRPAEWAGRPLADGDHIELLRLVAGG